MGYILEARRLATLGSLLYSAPRHGHTPTRDRWARGGLRKDTANRQLAYRPRDHVPRVHDLHRLHDVGGAPGQQLLRRAVPVAVLFARAVHGSDGARRGRRVAGVVRRRAELVAVEAAVVLTGDPDPRVPR